MEALAAYYRSPAVRARMAEYCGGEPDRPGSFSTHGLAGYGGRRHLRERDGAPVAAANASWGRLLRQGADVCRALADRRGTLLLLDIDYTNPRDPAEPYRDPRACFDRLEPTYRTVLETFRSLGVQPLVLMTGRGYHFTFRAPFGSPFQAALVELGALGRSMRARYAAVKPGAPAMGRAHDGAGRLLEHLCHETMRRLEGHSPVPLTIADVPPAGFGPFICLDLTAYADPLFERHARCAFSGNQKASASGLAVERPFAIVLPRTSQSLATLLQVREDPVGAAEMADRCHTWIPDVSDGVRWIEEYRRSSLARFHREFDHGPHLAKQAWPYTYDVLDLGTLPPCAGHPLQFPNPALLQPVNLRTVALALHALGWHPRSIAELIRSRYEQDHAWGELWQRYDPQGRAAFYVRILCAADADGLEQEGDFTCASQAGRGVCDSPGCPYDLSRLPRSSSPRSPRADCAAPNPLRELLPAPGSPPASRQTGTSR